MVASWVSPRLAALALLLVTLPSRAPRAQETPGPPPSGKPAGAPRPSVEALPADVKAALLGIHGEKLTSTIRFLASPRLEGRESGERGAEIAADYLVSRYQAAGLVAGWKEGFLQRWSLRRRTLALDEAMTLSRRSGSGSVHRKLELRTDWSPFGFSEPGEAEAPLVFAGFGISAPEFKWDDYAALGPDGARGKIAVVLRHEPDEEGTLGSSFFDGREMTMHASFRQKARVAAAHGAVGIIVVDDPANHEVKSNPSSSLSGWTILTDEERKLPKEDPKRPVVRPDGEDEDAPLGIVAVIASQELLRWIDPNRDWKRMQKEMEAARKPAVLPLADLSVKIVHHVETELDQTANVVALLPGTDPVLSKEYVLVGGHYDHVGKSRRTGEIHPGADDNASGTATVLAVAEAFASLPKAPARSLLFCAWSGEEEGLLGSEWFVHHPVVPLEKIVAAVNLDMVGRNKEGEMSVVGRPEMPDFVELFDRFAPEVGFTLNDDAGAGASRSDNGSLWLGGVPTVSLFSGTHEDYHEPSDTADKIVPGKVEKAARLTFLVVREIADGRETPKRLDVPLGPWKPIAPPPPKSAEAKGAPAKESK